jgi:predicted GH43/DUF377 family glycosyl hydrolase
VYLDRSASNPILTRREIPAIPPLLVDPTSVFNPGAVRYDELFVLLLRVQSRGRETFLLRAASGDGEHFEVAREVVHLRGLEAVEERIYHVYDPRITMIGDICYIMVAMDTDSGCRLGTVQTYDFRTFDLLGIGEGEDVRNGVLFPEQIGGRFLRLDRPNRLSLEGGPTSGDEIVLSESKDLVEWKPVATVLRGRPHYWDERIGSGPPPVKTREGWLHVYHGIATHFGSVSIYQAGVVLLDLKDPTIVKARSRNNILEPRETYELIGQVPNVVFPSGMIVDSYDKDGCAVPDSKVWLYYGAADTSVALATTTVSRLIDACQD